MSRSKNTVGGLLNLQADLYTKTKKGRTVLDSALQLGQAEVVEYLKKKALHDGSSNVLISSLESLVEAIDTGDTVRVCALLDADVCLPEEGNKAFAHALASKNSEMVLLLIHKRAVLLEDISFCERHHKKQ